MCRDFSGTYWLCADFTSYQRNTSIYLPLQDPVSGFSASAVLADAPAVRQLPLPGGALLADAVQPGGLSADGAGARPERQVRPGRRHLQVVLHRTQSTHRHRHQPSGLHDRPGHPRQRGVQPMSAKYSGGNSEGKDQLIII